MSKSICLTNFTNFIVALFGCLFLPLFELSFGHINQSSEFDDKDNT